MSMGASPSGDDENVVAAPDHLEPLQSQPPVADAFAGFELVLVAVPGTDEMHLVGERLPLIAAVRRDHVDHPVDHQALAGRPAGMDAVVAVGEIVAVLVEHADFRLPGDDDAPVAVPHFRRLGDEAFRHGLSSLARMLPRPWTGGAWHAEVAGRASRAAPNRKAATRGYCASPPPTTQSSLDHGALS